VVRVTNGIVLLPERPGKLRPEDAWKQRCGTFAHDILETEFDRHCWLTVLQVTHEPGWPLTCFHAVDTCRQMLVLLATAQVGHAEVPLPALGVLATATGEASPRLTERSQQRLQQPWISAAVAGGRTRIRQPVERPCLVINDPLFAQPLGETVW
jgi:hypothetical protein